VAIPFRLPLTPYRTATANYALRFNLDLCGLALCLLVSSRAWIYKHALLPCYVRHFLLSSVRIRLIRWAIFAIDPDHRAPELRHPFPVWLVDSPAIPKWQPAPPSLVRPCFLLNSDHCARDDAFPSVPSLAFAYAGAFSLLFQDSRPCAARQNCCARILSTLAEGASRVSEPKMTEIRLTRLRLTLAGT
jgi:hypothetical protein